jgi:hypothetical protein
MAAICLGSLVQHVNAAKYDCAFYKDNTSLYSCKIDSADAAKYYCTYKYSGDISGTCLAVALSSSTDILACLLHHPEMSAADAVRATIELSLPSYARAMATPKGFAAGGATLSVPNAGTIQGFLIEKQGAAQLNGNCSRI